MTYAEFKRNYPIGSSVASPEGTYLGECVSYVRQYMALVHGVKTGPLGHAVDFATNSTFLKHYQKVSNPQPGDIIVWGDDVGNWTSKYGHIAIYDGAGVIWNQNYNGSRVVSKNKYFDAGFIGYYRKKGATMPTEKDVRDYFSVWLKDTPTAAEIKDYTSKPWRYFLDKLLPAAIARNSNLTAQQKADIALGKEARVNNWKSRIIRARDILLNK